MWFPSITKKLCLTELIYELLVPLFHNDSQNLKELRFIPDLFWYSFPTILTFEGFLNLIDVGFS